MRRDRHYWRIRSSNLTAVVRSCRRGELEEGHAIRREHPVAAESAGVGRLAREQRKVRAPSDETHVWHQDLSTASLK
eukprot:1484655-Alexandrium_andersonii.AAC.1